MNDRTSFPSGKARIVHNAAHAALWVLVLGAAAGIVFFPDPLAALFGPWTAIGLWVALIGGSGLGAVLDHAARRARSRMSLEPKTSAYDEKAHAAAWRLAKFSLILAAGFWAVVAALLAGLLIAASTGSP